MNIDEKFLENFNKKPRDCCSNCGGVSFIISNAFDMDISEMVLMTCQDCSHERLELV